MAAYTSIYLSMCGTLSMNQLSLFMVSFLALFCNLEVFAKKAGAFHKYHFTTKLVVDMLLMACSSVETVLVLTLLTLI